MNISDTSALVLNWTSKDVLHSKAAQDYFDSLDLSGADKLLKKFNAEENNLQTQMLHNRKFFVRKYVVDFLEKYKKENISAQVIILAAGIDPLSVEIASLYPHSKVFDVDKYAMNEKEKHLDNVCKNIHFIEADITNIQLLKQTLTANDWNEDEPCLLIMEGIIYYLHEDDFKNILTFFADHVSAFVCDFGIKAECIDAKDKFFGEMVCSKIIETAGIEFMNRFEPQYFLQLLKQCGFKNPEKTTMAQIQQQRTGKSFPFEGEEPAWVALTTCQVFCMLIR